MKLKFWHGLVISALIWLILANQAAATTYTLTVASQGPGTVTRNPSNASYPAGVTVTITATPDAGAYFSSWSGDTNGTVNPLNIVMNNNYVITGNFTAFPTYPLTLTTNGQGSIALSPSGNSFASNSVVTATATPASGWVFTGWTGSAAGPTNPLSFTMNSSNSLTGNFVQLPAFDVQPVGVTNAIGANVSLSAHSVGTAPVSYQWYFNGAGVTGATNTTLNFNNVQFASAGSYQLIATNLYGSATSSVALLVVTNGFSNPVSVCDEPSLRAAIAAGGWIQFGCNGTITLSNTIAINNNVILDGSLVNATISGGNAVRIFYVTNGASLTISNLTLANGTTNNAGHSVIADGGAIYNDGGTLNLIGCNLLNNAAYDHATTVSFPGYYPARGGAIFNNGGYVMLVGTGFSNNVADGATSGAGVGNGGAIYMTNGSLTMINCVLTTNSCRSCYYNVLGGAVCVTAGTVVISDSQFNANTAISGGFATTMLMQGGAIALLGGNLTVSRCQFVKNQINDLVSTYVSGLAGGALYCAGTASIRDSSFVNNQLAEAIQRGTSKANGQGGAICNVSNLVVNGCCIASNFVCGLDSSSTIGGYAPPGDGYGAGVFNGGQLWMTNCTIALNKAQGGAAYYQGYNPVSTNGSAIGAGLFTTTGGISWLMNVTIASNYCVATNAPPQGNPNITTNGFTAGAQVANVGGILRLHNSLIAYSGTNGNAYGTITDDGYNISSDGSAAFASGTSYNFTDPQLLALMNNGGLTLTMGLASNSPAIDNGDANGAPPIDQRGGPRPIGGGYDMGAVESGATNAPITLAVSIAGSGTVNENPSNTTYPSGVTVTLTATPSYGSYFAGWSGYTNSSANPLNVVMNSSVALTATFLTSPVYVLTLTTNGQGTIALSPAGNSYPSNTMVTATATPAGGWIFTGWSGSAAGPTNPLSFVMNSSKSLTGNFAQLPGFDVQPVTVTNGLGGTVTFISHSVGYPAPAYQWYYNGTALPDATSASLSLNGLSLAQAGFYQVIATNNYGSAASSTVALVLTNGTGYSNPVYVCDEPSLRSAVAAGGWIGFGCNGTITLTSPLTVSNNVILDGSFVNVTISGGNAVRLFNVSSNVSLTISNVTLANGSVTNGNTTAYGGAIFNNGTVSLVACTLSSNVVAVQYQGVSSALNQASGGAIYNNQGNLNLMGCAFNNNLASGSVSGLSYGTALGGAIYSTNGNVTILGCSANGNASLGGPNYASASGDGYGRGGFLYQAGGTLQIVNSVINSNLCQTGLGQIDPSYATGGALCLVQVSATISGTRFEANTCQGGNAGYQHTATSGYGGAIFNLAILSINNCTFVRNATVGGTGDRVGYGGGGAIYNASNLVLNASTLCSNSVTGGGGGIYQGGSIPGCPGFGGGIENAGTLFATNCTVAQNIAYAGHFPGYLYFGFTDGIAVGGGLFNSTNGALYLMNTTVASNACISTGSSYSEGGGISYGDQLANSNGTFNVHNTLITGGTNGIAYGLITDGGYNICADGTAAFASGSSYNFTDPKLAALADNGGPTLTMMPLDISPAIDTADANGAPSRDQRNRPRPFGSGYDMGAVEYGSTLPAVWLNSVHGASSMGLSFSNTPGIAYYLLSSTNLTSWTVEQVIGPFNYPTNITIPVSSQGKGGKFYRLHY